MSRLPSLFPAARVSAALTLFALLAATAPAALAAPATSADAAAELGWLRVQPSGWDFPLYLPQYGELHQPGRGGETRAELGGNDLLWADPTFQPDYSFAYQIDGQYAELAAGSPGDSGWSWLDAFMQQNLTQQAGATITASDLHLSYGGRRWLRYDFDQPDPATPGALLHSIACVTPCNKGIATVRFYIADTALSSAYATMLAQVLGGPLPELNGGEGAVLEDSLPATAPPAPLAPAVDDAKPGELPRGDAVRMVTPPSWGTMLQFPGSGSLRVRDMNGVTADDLNSGDFMWFDSHAASGAVFQIEGLIIETDAAQALSYEQVDATYRGTFGSGSDAIVASNTAAQYGGQRWLQYEISDPEGGVHDHYFALLAPFGLGEYLIHFYTNGVPDAAAAAQVIAQTLHGM